MVCIMIGAALMVFWVLVMLLSGRAAATSEEPSQARAPARWTSPGSLLWNVLAVLIVVAGVSVLLWRG